MGVRPVREPVARAAGTVALAGAAFSAETNLQLTMPLVWVMLIMSLIGAAVTFGALIWTLWKYRDPAARGRRYG